MPEVVYKDHYAVLGVKHDATPEEIKKRYRALAREFHPDVLGPDAPVEDVQNATELFKEVSVAYEHLSEPEKRRAVDRHLGCDLFGDRFSFTDFSNRQEPKPVQVPEPGQYLLNGIWCWIEFRASHWRGSLYAVVTIQLADLFKVTELGDLPHSSHVTQVIAVDKKGDVVGRSFSLRGLHHNILRLQAEARRNEERRVWRQQLLGMEDQYCRLEKQGKPVSQLDNLLTEADRLVDSGTDSFRRAVQRDTVIRAIREVEKEIERVSSLDGVEVLLSDLFGGKIQHPDLEYNEELLQKLRVYQFRSGGEYTAPTSEDVEAHYRKRLQGLKRHRQVKRADLKLPDDELTILELASEGALELAPDTVEIRSNKGISKIPVTYGYTKVDGEAVPAGIITVTEPAYRRNCAQYGKASQLPTLPYNIRLLVRVEVRIQDKQTLTDPLPDGKALQNEVARCQAKLRNPKEPEELFDTASYLVLWTNF